jgi:GT2 family glycosyltransferase
MKDVTFAILSFNHPVHTSRAVQSVQKLVPDSQILLLHNGSRQEVETTLRNEFSSIHHITLKDNRGFTGGANHLLSEASQLSKWVMFITNDCELLSVSNGLPTKPGIYAPLIYRRSTSKIDSIGATFTPLTGRLRHLRKRPSLTDRVSRRFYIPGTAFLIDRDTWFELCDGDQKLFDESLHTYWEDVDLSMRAHKRNIHMEPWPQIQLLHKIGKTCHKDPFYTRYLFQRNRRIVSRRYVSSWLRPLQAKILGPGPEEINCST